MYSVVPPRSSIEFDQLKQSPVELPSELLVQIFILLDLRSLMRCHLVCRIFNEIIANSPLLQYKMELEIAGLVDRSSIELPVTAKLSHLKAYQEAFKSTQKTLWRTSFNKGFSLVYSGDVGFVLSHTSIPEDLRDHPLLYDTIDVCHVPPASFSHDTPCCCEWWTIHATCPFTSISADPSQDLVILYDADIVSGGPDGTPLVLQVLSISSGKTLSTDGPLHIPLPDTSSRWQVFNLHIWGDLISVILGRFRDEYLCITIMRWRDGMLIAQMKVPRSAHHDFRFISESTFLLENRECGEGFGLHLYSFDPNLVSTSGPSDQHSTVPSPKRIAIFQFPPLASSEIRLWMSMVGLNMRGAYASKDNGRIFEVCRTRGVLVIHLVANRDIEIQLRNYLIFIDPSIFQNFPAQLQSDPDTTSTIVPWSAWGQKNTRWAVDAGLRPSLGPRCYGTRVLLPDRLLDFNCLDVARDLNHVAVTGRDQYSGNLVGRDSPTLHPAGSVFREDVVSELPYREVKHGFEGPIWNICPGEDWVHR